MTAVKEQLVQMIPQMPMIIPHLTEERAQQIYNLFITVNPKESRRADISNSGLDLGPDITDENHDERMARAFALADDIEIDEQAIKDLREASMV